MASRLQLLGQALRAVFRTAVLLVFFGGVGYLVTSGYVAVHEELVQGQQGIVPAGAGEVAALDE